MNFFQAIESVFTNIDNAEGRACRSEYNYWLLFNFIFGFALGMMEVFFNFVLPISASIIINLIFFGAGITLMIRRFHDINKSGYNYFWNFTIIGIIPIIYWLSFKRGDQGENHYGTDPFSK